MWLSVAVIQSCFAIGGGIVTPVSIDYIFENIVYKAQIVLFYFVRSLNLERFSQYTLHISYLGITHRYALQYYYLYRMKLSANQQKKKNNVLPHPSRSVRKSKLTQQTKYPIGHNGIFHSISWCKWEWHRAAVFAKIRQRQKSPSKWRNSSTSTFCVAYVCCCYTQFQTKRAA